MREVDLAIVGAGPAGLSTALHLLQRDPHWSQQMILLEKEEHPRHKLCGGGITRFGLNHLRRLNLKLTLPYAIVEKARFCYGNWTAEVRGKPVFVVVHRAEFDAWLAQEFTARGGELVESSPVAHLTREGEGIRLSTPQEDYLARAVVGADGSRGIVRRWLSKRESPPRVARVLEIISEAEGSEQAYADRVADFDFTGTSSHLQGYHWDFPSYIGGLPHFNRGVYDARAVPSKPRANLLPLLWGDRRGMKHHEDLDRVQGHPIHWFTPWNQFSDQGIVLVGDAAGADPLFGEGISISLGYGQVAADALHNAFLTGDFSFKSYPKRLRLSPVGRYLILRWFVASVVYRLSHRPRFVAMILRLASKLSEVLGSGRALPEVYPAE